MRGDEPGLCVVQREPHRGDEAVQMRRELSGGRPNRNQVVSAGEAHNRERGERGDGETGKAIAGDVVFMARTFDAAGRRTMKEPLKAAYFFMIARK